MAICNTRYTDIDYLDDGPADGTPVVFVHGFPDIPETWDQVIPLLPPGLRLIRPFLRGVGGSRVTQPEARSGQVAALATDLLDLVDSLDLEPIVLVGHDWGARASHAFAVLAPDKVRGLITLATAYGPSSHLSGEEILDEAAAAWYRYWLCTALGEATFRDNPRDLISWAWRRWSPLYELPLGALERILADIDTDEFVDNVVHYYQHGAAEAPGRSLYSAAQDLLDTWPKTAAPTTFLLGTADGCETPSLARANERYFTSGRDLIELDGVGHFIQREHPQAVADAILRHL